MNWTGGALSRSRRQNSNLTAIQKKHFAKARAQLLSGRPSEPRLDATIFGATSHNNKLPSFATTSNRLQEQHSTQLTLEDFENIRPVVKQLQSLRPRRARDTAARPRATKSVSSPRSSRQQITNPNPYLVTQLNSHGSTSTQRAMAPTANANTATEAPAQDELEMKRRDLLGTSDWMGLERMKPVQIKFPEVQDRDLIGKRRRIRSDQYQTVPATNQYRRPIINSYEKLHMLQGSSNTTSSPGKISIHIGSPDKGPSTRRRRESGSASTHHELARASQEMLFDDQESSKAVPRGRTSTTSSLQQPMNSSDDMLFNREWSGIASPLGTESTGLPKDSYHDDPHRGFQATGDQPHAPAADMVSGRTASEYLQELQHVGEDLEGYYDPDETGLDRGRFRPEEAGLDRMPSAPAQINPVHLDRRVIAIHDRISSQVQTPYGLNAQSSQGRRSSDTSRNANSPHPSQFSTAHPEKRSNGQSFAQATARDLCTLFPTAGNSKLSLHTAIKGQNFENEVEAVNLDIRDNHPTPAEKGSVGTTEPPLQGKIPTSATQSPPAHSQDAASVPAGEVFNRSPLAPVAPETAEDEEIIWRTF
ncbi:MAG: hypothetical protein Q9211_005056, partial [Gyalolechia sp. 1 TL-2023]